MLNPQPIEDFRGKERARLHFHVLGQWITERVVFITLLLYPRNGLNN
jgi:hypothetical protein